MLKERLTYEEIARLPVYYSTEQLWEFNPAAAGDRLFSLVIEAVTKWIRSTEDPNTGFSVTPDTVTITWIDDCIYSLWINFEEGFVSLHADCVAPDVAEMVDNICCMLVGISPFHSGEEGIRE